MNSAEYWKKYFKQNNQSWVKSAYESDGYVYPVGYHRLRVLKKILKDYDLHNKKVLDIGCGGGNVSFYLSSLGAQVDGIDMTEEMLKIANEKREQLSEKEKYRIHFFKENISNLSIAIGAKKYDIIVAFGLIGYLESDAKFFDNIRNICKEGTLLVISCRNQLFNITSVTANTRREIEEKNAQNLIDEIDSYYESKIPKEKSIEFLRTLNDTAKILAENVSQNHAGTLYEFQENVKNEGSGDSQPRQSTPKQLCETAQINGFVTKKLCGVHPHLLLPKMNRLLPPYVFNAISDSLCVFEEEPISLVYSSVFIGVFEKR